MKCWDGGCSAEPPPAYPPMIRGMNSVSLAAGSNAVTEAVGDDPLGDLAQQLMKKISERQVRLKAGRQKKEPLQ
jgi:hypothetical protein